MIYKEIKPLGKEVSSLIYGCANRTMLAGEDNSYILDSTLAAGINIFDTARHYGRSEESLGKWLKESKHRNEVVIVSKCCHPIEDESHKNRVNAEAMRQDLDVSLQTLGLDYIDIYLLHRDDLAIPVSEMIEAMQTEKKKGKIGAYGVSNWTRERIQEANEYANQHHMEGFTISSPNYSLASQIADPWQTGSEAITLGGPEHRDDRIWYEKNRIPIFAYSSLGRGMFSGRVKSNDPEGAKNVMDEYALRGYFCEDNLKRLKRAEGLSKEKGVTVSQLALAWLMNQRVQVHPIVSYTSVAHMEENLRSTEIELSEAEIKWLDLHK